MEKLTWLATERRLSQEGDSEEENSQEENSEPEEEEEEEGEGIESLQKDDEICGDTSEEPKSAFTMAKAASPQVEAHRMPAGECCGGSGCQQVSSLGFFLDTGSGEVELLSAGKTKQWGSCLGLISQVCLNQVVISSWK